MKLADSQVRAVKEYLALLETVEEGLDYVEESFTDYEKTEGDVVLSDIITAFMELEETHVRFRDLFAKDPALVESFNEFKDVLIECLKLEDKMEDQNAKQQIVKESLSPVYRAWMKGVYEPLSQHLVH